MNRRIAVITSVSFGLLLSVAMLGILWRGNVSKITVSFVNAETSYAAGFALPNGESERLAFEIRSDGNIPMRFEVYDIKDEHDNWIQPFTFPSSQTTADIEVGKITRLYLYLPKGSHPQALRLRGYKNANPFEKALFALKLLSEKASGRYPAGKVWFEELSVIAYESIVKIDIKAEPAHAANTR
jgi:hypothetical protein